MSFFHKPWVVPTSVGIASGAVGFIGGYFVGRSLRRQEVEQYEQLQFDFTDTLEISFDAIEAIEKQRALIESFDSRLSDEDLNRMDEELNQPNPHAENLVVNEVNDPEDIVVEHQPNYVNIFNDELGEWNYELELNNRSEDIPYVLHYNEFFNEEMGFGQSTLTYYEGDDILTDENDVPIYNHSSVVGELLFGHGSNDPNVVYIRNEKLHAEYEVLREPGSYQVEILGADVETSYKEDLKHSKHQVPKFRPE